MISHRYDRRNGADQVERGTALTVRHAEWLLAAVIAARATSFLFSKILLIDMGPLSLLGLRFAIAFVLLAALFRRSLRGLSRRDIAHGAVIGASFFATMVFELCALDQAPSSRVSLLENVAIVLVPLGEAALARRLPRATTAAAALFALGGVACLTAGGSSEAEATWGAGDGLALGAAACYAIAIMATARLSREGDALGLGIVQIGVMGALGLAAAFLFDQPSLPANEGQWASLAALVIVCTGFGFTLQPLAQRYLSADRAALFCALTPLVASLLGIVVLGEPAGPATFAGLALIVGAMAIANLPAPEQRAQARARTRGAGRCG